MNYEEALKTMKETYATKKQYFLTEDSIAVFITDETLDCIVSILEEKVKIEKGKLCPMCEDCPDNCPIDRSGEDEQRKSNKVI